jgi:hypothetical protein
VPQAGQRRVHETASESQGYARKAQVGHQAGLADRVGVARRGLTPEIVERVGQNIDPDKDIAEIAPSAGACAEDAVWVDTLCEFGLVPIGPEFRTIATKPVQPGVRIAVGVIKDNPRKGDAGEGASGKHVYPKRGITKAVSLCNYS